MSAGSNNRSWERAERAIRTVETWLITAILGGLILLGAAQIVLRNLFSAGFSWADGLARLAVLWLALLGALAATRDGRHITMGAVTRWLPQRWQTTARIAADLFGAGVTGAMGWYAWVFVGYSKEGGDTLLGDLPAWWLQLIMPVAFSLMALEFLLSATVHAGSLSRAKEQP